ncbi:ATP-binding protein [Actinomadura rubteroloni]|uniref:ATP-binding protein n=1 Tax=Actinomadura rubteroloni TaxID=1926885 RepID=UPI000CD9349E|nr:LuxR C-terminal-related transcriptional regulator [Actinomadura rubteroloni]
MIVTVLAEMSRAGNLPAEMTRFIGRQRELGEARQVLARSRLVTLTGVGGVGKTRLAVRVAADLRRSFPDGAWLVELSALREPALLARTVADALRLPGQASGDQTDRLADHLSDKHLLLVLDTCEHLVDGCATLTEVLLRAAPRLRILATSREPLDVMGEHTLVIPPLPVADQDSATGDDAVTLFADRAEAMVPGFALTRDNHATVARLCRHLDGIPLAIELAAVRLRSMSVEQLVDRIDDRFRLLGTPRAAGGRHRTLRATIEWSHDLCTAQERLLWARLSVFPGDFDLAAAERVGAGGALAADALLDVLARLVEKSIVLCERDGRRYRMLDTLREYGAERLTELGERPDVLRRHRDHYLALAEEARRDALGAGQLPALIRLREENANLRVALEHSLSTPGDEETALHLAAVLQHYWLCLGKFGEALSWQDRVLTATEALPPAHRERAWVAFGTGLVAVQRGEAERGRALFERADAADDPVLRAHILHGTGLVALFEGELEGARTRIAQAREEFARLGHEEPAALLAGPHLSSVLALESDWDAALAVAEESVRAGEASGEVWNRSFALYARAAARWWTGRKDEAVDDLMACLQIKEDLGDQLGITLALDLLTPATLVRGRYEEAAMLLGATERMWRELGAQLQYGPHYMERRALSEKALQRRLPADRFQSAKRRGGELTITEAIALARGEPVAAPGPAPARETLTTREREVAALVAEGLTNRQIADRLVLAKRTVDSHVEHILTKLGFTARTEIAAWTPPPD